MSGQTNREWAESLRDFMLGQVRTMEEAKRRLWKARDEHALAKTRLTAAKLELAAAERDYSEHHELLTTNWDFFRSEYERVHKLSLAEGDKIPTADAVEAILGTGD